MGLIRKYNPNQCSYSDRRTNPYWEKTLNALYSVHMETCVLELHHVFYHAWSMMQSRMHCWPFVLDIQRCINMDALQNLTEVSGLNFWCICSGDRCFGAFWCAEISFVAAKKMTVIIICSLQNSEVTERNECSTCHTLCLYLCICPCVFVYLPLAYLYICPCVFVYCVFVESGKLSVQFCIRRGQRKNNESNTCQGFATTQKNGTIQNNPTASKLSIQP